MSRVDPAADGGGRVRSGLPQVGLAPRPHVSAVFIACRLVGAAPAQARADTVCDELDELAMVITGNRDALLDPLHKTP